MRISIWQQARHYAIPRQQLVYLGFNKLGYCKTRTNNRGAYSDVSHLDWFLVHCKPNAAHLARQNLKNQNFPVFLPMQKVTERKSKEFQTMLRPLFPGYLFVQIDQLAGSWRKINNTRGVARIVQLGANPCPLPDTVMAELIERCDAKQVLQDSGSLEVGNQARISQGPFSGLIADIVRIKPDRRVHLLLDIMGQATEIMVTPSSIIPAR